MIWELLGFLLSSAIFAVASAYFLTGDIYPKVLKKFMYRLVLSNWKEAVPARLGLGLYNVKSSKTIKETGVFPMKAEKLIEQPQELETNEDEDCLVFYGIDHEENSVVVRVAKFKEDVAYGTVYLRSKGKRYTGSAWDSKSNKDFSCGNLKLEMVEAMRCWRVWYNGILRDEETKSFVHGTINFLWKPLDGPKDAKKDANHYLLSNQVSEWGKFGSQTLNQTILLDGYSQYGTLHGTIKLEDGEENEAYLYGYRVRNSGKLNDKDTSCEVFGMCHSSGNSFRLSATKGLWTVGEYQHVSTKCFNLQNVDVRPADFENNQVMPKLFTLEDSKSCHRVEVWPKFVTAQVGDLEIEHLTLTLNSVPTVGVVLRRLNAVPVKDVRKIQISKLVENAAADQEIGNTPDFVAFGDRKCLDVSLTGGKGASLAAVTKFCETNKQTFKTAKGFCVTTAFFRNSLDLNKFEEIFKNAKDAHGLEDTCRRVQQVITDNGLDKNIEFIVSDWMQRTFPEHNNSKRFAVRSSGTLEDGADVSCAGQNKTVLGVDATDVPKSIIVCWASLFTYQSVTYRLNHGQPAVSDMGVVVQEMVEAEAAGVLFTANPIYGNPFELLINANYGLGESVVSASCDPDTIILKRSKDGNDLLSIHQVEIGDKASKLMMDDDSSGAVVGVALNAEESSKCCIDNGIAIKLGEIGLELVKDNSERPLDIEWAVLNGNIYILQSRNITSLDAWTDFEIIHELDTALRTCFERLTDANTGEVMPGASSPLGLSTITKVLDFSIQKRFQEQTGETLEPSCIRATGIARQRLLLLVIQTFYRHVQPEIDAALVAADISICGHRVVDEEMHKLAVERWGVDTALTKAKNIIHMIQLQRGQKKEVDKAAKQYGKYVFNFENVKDDPLALFARIQEEFIHVVEICKTHCAVTEASSGSQIVAFLILASGKKLEDWDADLFTDLSKLLAVSKGVESAEVPNAMNEIADEIIAQGPGLVGQISGGTPEEALKILQSHDRLSSTLNAFLEKHGHRSMRELDLAAKSWKQDPLPFISLVQSIVTSKSKFKGSWKSNAETSRRENASYDDILDSLKTPIAKNTRRGLKFVLPYCQASVQNRERTKSLLVWTVYQLKLGMSQLAKLLVRDGVIGDENLINFLKFHEIGELLQKAPNSARILYKALRRQKLYPILQEEEFEEVMAGIPRPKDKFEMIEIGDTMKGTPVSSGRIQGTAKVCHSVEEASELIKPGDILITHGTDIGWSPFFPILGGVITELGGLISHGAVVAREYGLPCVVGAGNATKFFSTGETIILDANRGIISKVK